MTDELARAVAGGWIPPLIDGPRLEHFHPLELAAGIDSEIQRASMVGWERIQLTMGLYDAALLAQYLRKVG